ncbi:sodium-independent sulfate anion transporter-like [Sitophilus oryzae]|uniref:Sodium-independent sulfate anion transporter-like n=1 Tax=Sitophilus oryzae TaxID=7048 RepID=A0A6J2X4H2_SITOR|nr:sodium-independent sulfate anion transporter-like [Sitophilus oryzae]
MAGALDLKDRRSVGTKIKKVLQKRLHFLQWLPKYSKKDILADFVAGITVGMTMIPQSVAYAGLAGLKPQYGLYTAFIGSFTYIFFGSVKEVSIGPTSLMAILTFSYVKESPIEYVILLTFIAGCIELAMGLFKLGFLVDFLSPCLTSGFTSATSIIILVSQLKNFLGLNIKSHETLSTIIEVIQRISSLKIADTVLGVLCVVFLLSFKQITKIRCKTEETKKLLWFLSISKNALVVLISSIISFIWFQWKGQTPFKLTGDVPSGLPDFSFPPTTAKVNNETVSLVDMVTGLGSGIIVVPLVAVLANVAIAKAYSFDTVVDASQEMISLGLANIFGSFVKAMPSCGAFTRSSVASSSGVVTPLQGLYSGSVIILALSFLAPSFYYIPKSTLAAVLIVAASSLVDFEIFVTLWRCKKIDFFMTLSTFALGILVSVEISIVIGAVFNALTLLKIWTRPRILIDIRTNEQKLNYIYVKPEVGLFYPAADYLSEIIKKAHNKSPYLPIVLDCSGILEIDYSAAKSVELLVKTYSKKQIQLILFNLNDKVTKTLSTIMDTSKLQLCRDVDVNNVNINIPTVDTIEENPLINGDSDRRYSEKKEDIRKGSLCDLE